MLFNFIPLIPCDCSEGTCLLGIDNDGTELLDSLDDGTELLKTLDTGNTKLPGTFDDSTELLGTLDEGVEITFLSLVAVYICSEIPDAAIMAPSEEEATT